MIEDIFPSDPFISTEEEFKVDEVAENFLDFSEVVIPPTPEAIDGLPQDAQSNTAEIPVMPTP